MNVEVTGDLHKNNFGGSGKNPNLSGFRGYGRRGMKDRVSALLRDYSQQGRNY